MFNEMDSDNDGVVTEAEFVKGFVGATTGVQSLDGVIAIMNESLARAMPAVMSSIQHKFEDAKRVHVEAEKERAVAETLKSLRKDLEDARRHSRALEEQKDECSACLVS